MSTSRRSTTFKHGNDCRQMGCPGHTLTIVFHHTSDTVSVLIDDEERDVFDEHMFFVMCNLGLNLPEMDS